MDGADATTSVNAPELASSLIGRDIDPERSSLRRRVACRLDGGVQSRPAAYLGAAGGNAESAGGADQRYLMWPPSTGCRGGACTALLVKALDQATEVPAVRMLGLDETRAAAAHRHRVSVDVAGGRDAPNAPPPAGLGGVGPDNPHSACNHLNRTTAWSEWARTVVPQSQASRFGSWCASRI